jgi:hypothetical protein
MAADIDRRAGCGEIGLLSPPLAKRTEPTLREPDKAIDRHPCRKAQEIGHQAASSGPAARSNRASRPTTLPMQLLISVSDSTSGRRH